MLPTITHSQVSFRYKDFSSPKELANRMDTFIRFTEEFFGVRTNTAKGYLEIKIEFDLDGVGISMRPKLTEPFIFDSIPMSLKFHFSEFPTSTEMGRTIFTTLNSPTLYNIHFNGVSKDRLEFHYIFQKGHIEVLIGGSLPF